MSETLEKTFEGLARLRSSAKKFARDEVQQIAAAVIEHLRSRPAYGTFSRIAARNLWDEYCWAIQGPFDHGTAGDDTRHGFLPDTFDDLIRGIIRDEVRKRPDYVLVFLTALAVDPEDQTEALALIQIDGIVSRVLEEVEGRASSRKLHLIGPDRTHDIQMEVEGSGLVWAVLHGRNEATDILAGHSDALLDPDADLTTVADEMVDAFMQAVAEETPGEVLSEFLDRFREDVRRLVREADVLPSLIEMRADLLQQLDA